jgi:hypothetical protein
MIDDAVVIAVVEHDVPGRRSSYVIRLGASAAISAEVRCGSDHPR